MNLDEVEQLKRLIVEPLIATVEEKLKAHVEQVGTIVDGGMKKVDAFESRVKSLETNQKRALLGWGAITVGTGTLITAAWNHLKGKLGLS